MKQITSHFPAVLVCLALTLAGCTQKPGDEMADDMDHEALADQHDDVMAVDAVTANPDVYKVLLDDNRVRILEMRLPAGVEDGWHSHPDEAAYFITGSKVRINLPDGETLEMDVPNGAPFSHEAWIHSVENIGDSEVHAIVVEQKAGARDSAGTIPEGMGAPDTSPDVYSVLLEDERVRILDMKLPAGQSDNDHIHSAEAGYFLTGGKARIHLSDGEVVEVDIPDGGVLSNPMWQHHVENVGETEIHAIVVELKQTVM